MNLEGGIHSGWAPGLLALLLAAAAIPAAAAPAWQLSGELGLGSDSNVAQVRRGGAERDDSFVRLSLGAERSWRLSAGSAMLWQLQLEGDAWARHRGLSQLGAALRWRWLHRPDAGFYTPTVWLSAAAGAAEFDSALRDAFEYRFGAGLQQQLTTRLAWRGGLALVWREGRDSAVFSGQVHALALDLDWQPYRHWALYAGYQWRDGDLVSTAPQLPPAAQAAARATAADDVFGGEIAFRLAGDAGIATGGANWSLSPALALDLQLRQIDARADIGTPYRRRQLLASLLWRY